MTVYFFLQNITYTLLIVLIFTIFISNVENLGHNQNTKISFDLQVQAQENPMLEDMKYYENQDLGISLFYLKDWQPTLIKNGIQFIKMENILVEIRLNNLEENNNLEQYFQEYIGDKREKRKDFNLISSQQYLLNGTVPAYNVVYTFTIGDEKELQHNGQTLKVYRILTLHGDKIYNIAYTSNLNDFVQFFEMAQNIISSIKIVDDN